VTAFASSLTRFWQWLLGMLWAARARFEEDQVSLRAMGLTYTTILSLAPFLAVTFSVLKGFGVQNQLQPLLARALEPLGPGGAEISTRLVQFVDNLEVGVLGTVGVAGLFYTAISVVGQIEDSLTQIWSVRSPRTWLERFRDYLSIVLVGPVLLFTALGVTASAQSHWLVQRALDIEPLSGAIVLGTRVFPFLFVCAAFSFLYKFIPHTHVRLRAAIVGGATAALLWQIAGAAFAAFVAGSTRYTAVYSSFAILFLFVLWLYVSWTIVLLGGQVARVVQYPRRGHFRGGAHASAFAEWPALTALGEIVRAYLAGEPPREVGALAARVGVPLASLEDLVDELVQHGILLRAAEPSGVTLARPPETVMVSEVLDVLRETESGHASETRAAIEAVLRRRDGAVREALATISLRALVQGEHRQASDAATGGVAGEGGAAPS
jgi:membrane protein